ncbi:charged multivesicular body protein 2b [Galendromus occidentalis]|uniref:Charged multivesicular body protein 2b n=1 Tax=Galendromus occidentalis TaxID=34638 RepID=A0AAJ6VXG9_9ACAR|nr:charged multivesicular body protein 2b [Galendromus occidentalis]
MDKLFGKKTNPKEELKKQDRELRKSERELAREDRKLEQQENQIVLEIKKASKLKNGLERTYAKQLIQVRKQRERTRQASMQLTGVRHQTKAMGANVALANSVAGAAKAMHGVNASMNPASIGKTLGEFKMASERMGMSEEMMNDVLDDILDEEGDEGESQHILDKVLDEIGIEMNGKLGEAPTVHGNLPQASKSTADEDIEKQLARLKAL